MRQNGSKKTCLASHHKQQEELEELEALRAEHRRSQANEREMILLQRDNLDLRTANERLEKEKHGMAAELRGLLAEGMRNVGDRRMRV